MGTKQCLIRVIGSNMDRKNNDIDGSDMTEDYENSIEFPNILEYEKQIVRKDDNSRKRKEIEKQSRMLR